MTSPAPLPDRLCTARLQRGVSVLALGMALVHSPALSQTAAILRGSAGLTSPVVPAPKPTAPVPAVAPNEAGMRSASARAIANQAAFANAQSLAKQANEAARAAARATPQTIPNGLVAGGLVPVANTTTAALDSTGLRTWEGASKPVQTGPAATPTVTIDQTAQRALLSWESFNVGRDTTLVFNQQPGWVALNRVVANVDPVTGQLINPAALAPSRILGTVKSNGTVLVINQNGIMFGPTAQVNTGSLLASSLEIGDPSRQTINAFNQTITVPTTLQERSISFLRSGILASANLVSAFVVPNASGTNVLETTLVNGSVTVDAGAAISSAKGGFVIIGGPKVTNAGQLTSEQGQVSLQSGRTITVAASSGAADSIDPDVRGLVLASSGATTPDSVITLGSSLISAPQGYVSLAGTSTGTATIGGFVGATTAVQRNGKIVIQGDEVTISRGAVIGITPDASTDTIPQGDSSSSLFKTSRIIIGGADAGNTATPSQIRIGADSLIYAPSANVSIGADNDSEIDTLTTSNQTLKPTLVDIASGVTIDVGGVKDLLIPASRNSIKISPAKRNELRDTPTYREALTPEEIAAGVTRFTLNGTEVFVDPRKSGVRADGVRWVGSPLIEAQSYYDQIGVTAAELMTSGGNLTIGARSFAQGLDTTVVSPAVTIASGVTLDVTGGWVRFEEGVVQTTRLRAADGRIVDISIANPNDDYVGIVDVITAEQPRFGLSTNFGNPGKEVYGFEPAYTEGRDAGSLTIKASTSVLAATVYGDAFAGTQQIASAQQPTGTSTIARDLRPMQAAPTQLPSGAMLKIAAYGTTNNTEAGGADIVVYSGSSLPARRASEILLSDSFLSGAGFSEVALQTSGSVSLLRGTNITLQPGGAFVIDAGRTVRLDGAITVPSGLITANTYEIPVGSVFRTDDDQPAAITAPVSPALNYDIIANGLLSTKGRWVNDSLVRDGAYQGGAWTDGGSVSLSVAPRVLVPIGTVTNAEFAEDLSGSIYVNASARIDVTGGGYVTPASALNLTGRGGDVSIINTTTYAQLVGQAPVSFGQPNRQLGVETPGFVTSAANGRQSGIAPAELKSEVVIAPGTIAAQGFAGGGSFTLVTPDLNFGGRAGETGTVIAPDFLVNSGFASFEFKTFKSRLLPNVFSNGLAGNTVLLDTEVVRIGSGETLRLTQSLIPSLLDSAQIQAVLDLPTGDSITGLLGTYVPTDAWDQRPVDLTFSGLIELQVASGGAIIGSPESRLAAAKLRNSGRIVLPGGAIDQIATLPAVYVASQRPAIGVKDLSEVFGAAGEDGYDENAPNALGIAVNGAVLSNADLVSNGNVSQPIYFLGSLSRDQGILLDPGSTTDLAGVSIRNPRADAKPGGAQKIDGRMIAGGRLAAASPYFGNDILFAPVPLFGVDRYLQPGSNPPAQITDFRAGSQLIASSGSTILIGGASDRYDEQTTLGRYELRDVWSGGGSIVLGGGGSIAGARISAAGGNARAVGGTLDWLNPVLRQANVAGQDIDVVAADQIVASGFDTFIARDRLTSIGNVNLTLGRAFYLKSRAFEGVGGPTALASYTANLAAGGNISINAGYIQLASPQQAIVPASATGEDTGTITLSGRSIDIIGGVFAEQSVTSLTLRASGDVRLIGVQPTVLSLVGSAGNAVAASLTGQLVASGDLTIAAAQVYATTGTGSLQQDSNAAVTGKPQTAVPFLVASTGEESLIRFTRTTTTAPPTPFAAGGNVLVQAARIEQNGVLRLPLGRLTLGSNTPLTLGGLNGSPVVATVPATSSLTLGSTSITSVSANGLLIPYGTTTDLIEYFFTPAIDAQLLAPPAAELRLAGDSVTVASGATVDASGGGDLFAYEFVPGVGGSRDVLSRFNNDPYSGNNGYQYPDRRQVYAIVPSLSSVDVAPYDPIYSSDYTGLYSATGVGSRVYLEAAPGLEAGWYTLLPAQYAILPGGFRVVENVGEAPPAIGSATKLLDGSLTVGGFYGIAGTGYESSQRLSFTVQNQESFRKYSNIQLTSATKTFTQQAKSNGITLPQMPADAARLILNPLSELAVNARFLTSTGVGGRGAEVDIPGNAFEILVPGATPTEGVISLTTTDFANLNAASLLIGGIRTNNPDGTTTIEASAQSITVANNSSSALVAPEILLAVGGLDSSITVADGAAIVATGPLVNPATGAYVIAADGSTSETGIGGLVRVANGPERLLVRTGSLAIANTLEPTSITIGGATLTGESILLSSSRDLVINNNATTGAPATITASRSLVLGGDDMFFTPSPSGYRGLVITPELEAQFAAAAKLTLVSPSIIGFSPGTHSFNDLSIDSRGIRAYGQAVIPPPPPREDQVDVPAADLSAPLSLTLKTGEFSFANSDQSRAPCGTTGTVNGCGNTGNTLLIDATSVRFGTGPMGIFGFDKSVTINAASGIFIEGVGSLDIGTGAFIANTPYIGDRSLSDTAAGTKLQPALRLYTSNAVILSGTGGPVPTAAEAPGATLAFGDIDRPVASFAADNIVLRASAGVIDVRSSGDVDITGSSRLATPGYAKTFGDKSEATAPKQTVSAPGGTVSLVSLGGDVSLGSGSTVVIGGGKGEAGTLQLSAAEGVVTLPGTIDASAPTGRASFIFDSGLGSLDLAGFLAGQGKAFTGTIRIRTGVGNLALTDGQLLRAESVRLTADGGLVDIAGTIDTSGINGGAIGLYGTAGVSLASTARLDASATGYGDDDTRAASGGAVELGTAGTGSLSIASGAVIDVKADRPGARLVPQIRKDPDTLVDRLTYNYAQSDTGGTVNLRAPVILNGAGEETVNILYRGSIEGAREVSVEGYRVYDLKLMAGSATCAVAADVCINAAGQAVIDLTATPGSNRFADVGTGGIPDFVRAFDLSASAAGLGALTGTPGYVARPGIELQYAGDIVLASNWNLGAGVVDVAAAKAAGLMQDSLQLAGKSYIVAGKEGEVFNNYTDMIYRVGGKASGAAGVLTFRAGGDLNITGSITDGFFTFGDQTDVDYMSYQLGGGQRDYRPALNFVCGGDDTCSNLFNEYFYYPGATVSPIPNNESATIIIQPLQRGQDSAQLFGPPAAPYIAAGNRPGALGTGVGGAGDPIGSAALMPLLTDGSAAQSFSLRLVGGAAPAGVASLPVTADPMSVAPASAGDVVVSGTKSYRAAPTQPPQTWDGRLQLSVFDSSLGSRIAAFPEDIFAAISDAGGTLDPNAYTKMLFSNASATNRAWFVKAAKAWFAANNIPDQDYQFFGPAANPTSLASSAGLFSRLLEGIGTEFVDQLYSNIPGRPVYPNPTIRTPTFLANPNIETRTLVRTGTGSIAVAAAGDVDLTNGNTVYRNFQNRPASNNPNSAQVGGTAIYTAGHIVAPGQTEATTVGTGTTLTLEAAYVPPPQGQNFLPNLQGVLNTQPVYATGGGSIDIRAGADVLARRDIWSEQFRNPSLGSVRTFDNTGTATQLWRVTTGGNSSVQYNAQINPQLFSTGVGALGGGSVTIEAARTISQLTAVSDTSLATANLLAGDGTLLADAAAIISYGGGDVRLKAGGNLLGGQVDVTSGRGEIEVGGAIASAGQVRMSANNNNTSTPFPLEANLLRLRLADATINVDARQSVDVAAIVSSDGEGFYSAASGVNIRSNGDFRLYSRGLDVQSPFTLDNRASGGPTIFGAVLPASVRISALFGDLLLSSAPDGGAGTTPLAMVASPIGQLGLFAGGDLGPVTLAMEDGDPSLMPGPLSAFGGAASQGAFATRLFGFPVVLPYTSDPERRLLHNERITHLGDNEPVRIFAGGDITDLSLWVPKAARIGAGRDIIDMVFVGQNLNTNDVTRIVAGRDIKATTQVIPVPTEAQVGTTLPPTANLPVYQGNTFVLGGPGTLMIEAGRNLGPFLNSATVQQPTSASTSGSFSYAGGILTVGNDYNPWLGTQGAKIYAQFGVEKGADYAALRNYYVNPANVSQLPGDLFIQLTDSNGNRFPDPNKPIYASGLVSWLVDTQPEAVVRAFGAPISITSAEVVPLLDSLAPAVKTAFLNDLPYLPLGGGSLSEAVAINRSTLNQPVLITDPAQVAAAPAAQRTNISGSTLIGWLAQNNPQTLVARYGVTSTSIARAYDQLVALPDLVQQQFLLDRVYFNELTAPSRPDGASFLQYGRGYSAVNMLFPPALGYTANDTSGTTNGGTPVSTGNMDLRLATIETQRGGDLTILGPGGQILGGSVVATSAQAARRGQEVYQEFQTNLVQNLFRGQRRGDEVLVPPGVRITAIPVGYEGIITLRGGSIRGFTDTDVQLNQSRLFTVGGGDVTLWSSNGDVNAGLGARTTASNPPVVVRFDPNAYGILDQAGSISGAGITALTPPDSTVAPSVTLIAPVGTVDAGDAGVRASGSIFVAAARIGNADSFKGGSTSGIGGTGPVNLAAAASANAASAAAAQAADAANPARTAGSSDQTRITIEVVGFAGEEKDDPCALPPGQRPTNCPVSTKP